MIVLDRPPTTAAPEPGPAPGSPRHAGWWTAGLLVALAGYAALFFVGGEVERIALGGLQSLPFVFLAVLAYAGSQHRWARVLTLIYLVLLTGGMALFVIGTSGVLASPATPGGAAERSAVDGLVLVARSGLLAVAALGIGWLGYGPTWRRLLARLIPIDPRSFVHATALVAVVSLTLLALVPLVVLGEPPLLLTIQQQGTEVALANRSTGGQLMDVLYAFAWVLPGAVLAVGFPYGRTLGEALRRLGLVRPTRGQVLFGIGMAFALVGLVVIEDHVINYVWGSFGWPRTDAKSFEQLIAFALTPLGAIVVGVTAGLGEEVVFRGVLQPRLGLLLSNVFFVSLHAMQYSADALVSVFILGLILGVIRQRTNTTTSALVHGLYDCLLVLIAVLGIPGF